MKLVSDAAFHVRVTAENNLSQASFLTLPPLASEAESGGWALDNLAAARYTLNEK